jgi:hypothetical protein
MIATAAPVGADPNPDGSPARTFDLDCGQAGTYAVVFVESHLGTFHVTGASTSIFQSTSLTIDGQVVFAEPGFDHNGRSPLTCTFTGVTTGRHLPLVVCSLRLQADRTQERRAA